MLLINNGLFIYQEIMKTKKEIKRSVVITLYYFRILSAHNLGVTQNLELGKTCPFDLFMILDITAW